jgi:hypothetical protein
LSRWPGLKRHGQAALLMGLRWRFHDPSGLTLLTSNLSRGRRPPEARLTRACPLCVHVMLPRIDTRDGEGTWPRNHLSCEHS